MIQVVKGDLIDQDVEVIVNSWNMNFIPWWLLLPQGVSGSIKRRAGLQPFRQVGNAGILKPGVAIITEAGRLKCKAIIHVAALNCLWISNEKIVRKCVRNAIAIAEAKGYSSVAFPLIGSGTGGLDPVKVSGYICEEIRNSGYKGNAIVVCR